MKKITKKLFLGITSILVISILLVGSIFLTQYRDISLDKAEDEILAKSEEIKNLGTALFDTQYDFLVREHLMRSVQQFTDSDLWIIGIDGEVVLMTTGKDIIEKASSKIISDLDQLKKDDSVVTYDYSNYMGAKTLTVLTPITADGKIIGVVMLHRNVNNIFEAYDIFNSLLLVSLLFSLLLSIIASIVYSYYFSKPIERLTKVAKEIGDGNYKIETNITQDDEIGILAKTMEDMAYKIDKNIEEILKLEASAKELVANVSHEFKTPLTLIRGYVENLEDDTLKPDKEIYNKIITNTKVLERLVNELLDLSKLQSGKVVLKKEALELNQVMNDVLVDMIEVAKLKNITIITKSKNKEIMIEADYLKLRQLFTIFIDNAIKYSNEDSKINITLDVNLITIKDRGIGIDDDVLDNIFERFYQANSNVSGYGLGLCIAKYIADMHGFNLEVESKKNKGTTIYIKL